MDSPDTEQHEPYMREAITLAQQAWGHTHPNPMVGCVIVEDGTIVARGYHTRAGQAHAEIEALRALARKPKPNAVLYVTLEPCSTSGKTGACTDAILKSGIQHVVVGALDPNPHHEGRGIDVMRDAGLTVETGVLAEACEQINIIFNHWIVKQRPLIAVKVAMTLDGKIATHSGHSKWITGETARADVMRWRRYFPAIGVGSGTVLVDNPSLTSRIDDVHWSPVRFIFDRRLRTVAHTNQNVYADAFAAKTVIVAGKDAKADQLDNIVSRGVSCWRLPAKNSAAYWETFIENCVQANITGVFIEGGLEVVASLLREQIIDYLFVYQAPKIFGDERAKSAFSGRDVEFLHEAIQIEHPIYQILGKDVLVHGKCLNES